MMRSGAVLRLHDLIYDIEPAQAFEFMPAWFAGAVDDPRRGWTADELAEHVRVEHSTYRFCFETLVDQPASTWSTSVSAAATTVRTRSAGGEAGLGRTWRPAPRSWLASVVPKRSNHRNLRFTTDELRELHLALAVRAAQLAATDTGKMGPSAKAKMRRRIDLCTELDHAVQNARGKDT